MILTDDEYVETTQPSDELTSAQENQLRAWIKARVRGKAGRATLAELYSELQASANPAWHKRVRVEVFEASCRELQSQWDAKRAAKQ